MTQKTELLTPVGRIVQGSLYDPKTTDAEGNPLVYKHGANQGQQRSEFYFALAIQKGHERHWSETEWGKKIFATGHAAFPNGAAGSPQFAWKVTDGDSNVPNTKGRKPCDREGYPNHWVLNFTSSFAPRIFNSDGTQQLLEPNHVNLGDYIQVYGNVTGNESTQQPGIFLNHSMVAFAGYGKRIVLGADPKAVGFGQGALPAGASLVPLATDFNPATTTPPLVNTTPYSAPMTPPPAYMAPPASTSAPVTPHHAILNPPPVVAPPAPPPAPAKVLTAKAQGATYEQLIAAGWNDNLLIQHGMMVA